VPTHDGRARVLDELLSRLANEPGAEHVEVCVSDNASRDATAAVIKRHEARFPIGLRYRRSERNLGMAENVMRSIELASSGYCWLMGSDDAPARGAVDRVLALMAEHHGTSGFVLGHARVTAEDLDVPGSVVAPELYPPQHSVTRFHDWAELTQSLGYMMSFTSNQVIHRDRWQAVVDKERTLALRAESAGHLYITGRMAARDPDWVWCPEPLVLSREAPLYLADSNEIGQKPGAIIRRIYSDLDRVFSALYARRSYAYRALMNRAIRHMWDREVVLELRTTTDSPQEYLANLGCVRYFWWSRWFWQTCFPVLASPFRPLRSSRRRRHANAHRMDKSSQAALDVSGVLPQTMTIGYGIRIRLRVRNQCSFALESGGNQPARIVARWYDSTSGTEVAAPATGASLWPPLRPGRSRRLELMLAPPTRPGSYVVDVTAWQAGRGWLDAEQPERALRGTVSVEAVRRLRFRSCRAPLGPRRVNRE
jgi:glycosyltransferase involved in cell wall biosynthesis